MLMPNASSLITLTGLLVVAGVLAAAQATPDEHRRFFALGDFRLESGGTLPNAKLAYATFGTLNERRDNAVLIPSGTARTITATTS